MDQVRGFVAQLVGEIRTTAPKAVFRPTTEPIGTCPKCGGGLHLRAWEGRNYVRCAGEDCRVSYDTDAEGKPLHLCGCGGPLRTFKDGAKACVLCGTREGEAAPPPAEPCPKCQRPMRAIPSTRRGQWFMRCSDCGVTQSR